MVGLYSIQDLFYRSRTVLLVVDVVESRQLVCGRVRHRNLHRIDSDTKIVPIEERLKAGLVWLPLDVLLYKKLDNQAQVSFALGQVIERACINFILAPKANKVNGSEKCYSDFEREANKSKELCCSCQMGIWECNNG